MATERTQDQTRRGQRWAKIEEGCIDNEVRRVALTMRYREEDAKEEKRGE